MVILNVTNFSFYSFKYLTYLMKENNLGEIKVGPTQIEATGLWKFIAHLNNGNFPQCMGACLASTHLNRGGFHNALKLLLPLSN